MTRRTFFMTTAAVAAAQTTGKRSQFGVAKDSYSVRKFRDTVEMLDHCHALGAAGIQAPLTSTDPDFLHRLRSRADAAGMYLEVQGALPKTADMQSFATVLKAARDVGARCIRTVNPGPRRYERFASLDEWNRTAAEADATLQRALPLIESMKVPVALENHRDWRLDEFVGRMKRYSSEYLGACVDLGNNLALLDLPMDVAERLAPYAITTHIKDMGVTETPKGFTMTEVPLGQGIIDLRRAMQIIRTARPKATMVIEMITRDPTPVACLTDEYWATLPDARGIELARTLRLVKEKSKPLPVVGKLAPDARMRLEDENVRKCLAFS